MPFDQAFIDAVNAARALHVRAAQFDQERSTFFKDLRKRGIDADIVKEIVRRFESDDPFSFAEFDEKLAEAIEIYSRSTLAPNLLRTPALATARTPAPATRALASAPAHSRSREGGEAANAGDRPQPRQSQEGKPCDSSKSSPVVVQFAGGRS